MIAQSASRRQRFSSWLLKPSGPALRRRPHGPRSVWHRQIIKTASCWRSGTIQSGRSWIRLRRLCVEPRHATRTALRSAQLRAPARSLFALRRSTRGLALSDRYAKPAGHDARPELSQGHRMRDSQDSAVDPLVAAARRHGVAEETVSEIVQRIGGRSCGECTACCHVKSVPELGKPTQRACAHLCRKGCGVYGQRPTSCREYACLWRQGFLDADERLRPDRLGVLVDYQPFASVPGTICLVVWELVPRAMGREDVRHMIDDLLLTYPLIKAVAWCAAGETAHHDFAIDRDTYPGEDVPPPSPTVDFDAARGIVTYEYRSAA